MLRNMLNLPGPGIGPVSPALAGGFLTTGPPGRPLIILCKEKLSILLLLYNLLFQYGLRESPALQVDSREVFYMAFSSGQSFSRV